MSLSSNDKEFLHRCIYDFFLWSKNGPLIEALQKSHPEACQYRTTPPSEQPLLATALCQYRDRAPDASNSTNIRDAIERQSAISDARAPLSIASRPTTRAGTKRRESSATQKNQMTTTTKPTTTTTTTSPTLVWNDYYEAMKTMMISKEQVPPDSLDPRGMLSWCVHQRWVYQKHHSPTLATTTTKAESASHLTTERIEKLDALGFKWERNPEDRSDRIIVNRQTPTRTQLTRWKQEFEWYKAYLPVVQKSNGQQSLSSAPPAPQTSDDNAHTPEDNASGGDDDDEDESSIQEKAQRWLAVQIERYRAWDAGFVDFTIEQREALRALHLLPALQEQGDQHYRFNLLLLLLHGGHNTSNTDEPTIRDKKSDHDNKESDGESERGDDDSSPNSDTDDEQESDSDNNDDGSASKIKFQKATTTTNGSSSSTNSSIAQQQNQKQKRPPLSDELWHTHWLELVEFKNKHGHTQVTRKANLKLGRWVTKERAKFRKLQQSYPPDRKKKLDDIMFCWEPNAVSTNQPKIQKPKKSNRIMVTDWNDRLAQMQAFYQKYGHVHVTNSLDPKLSSWVKKERIRYRANKAAYPSDRKQKLDDLGFCWEPIMAIKNQENEPYAGTLAAEKDALWWKRFQELKEYKERFGHVRIPSRWTENRELSNWYRHTKERYRGFLEGKNRLPKNRQKALEELEFDRLSRVDRMDRMPQAKTATNHSSEITETLVAEEIPRKDDEVSTKDDDATDSDTSHPRLPQDPKQQATLDLMPTDTAEAVDDSDVATNRSESVHPQRAVLGRSSRKRIRLPMQHEAKRPKRIVAEEGSQTKLVET